MSPTEIVREVPRSTGRLLAALFEVLVGLAAGAVVATLVSDPLVPVVVLGVVVLSTRGYRWVVDRRFRADTATVIEAAERSVAATKDQFLANVSHGLRTPLTGIVGFTHVLRDSLPHGEDRESAEMIMGESAELSRIIDDLLMATRLDAGVLEISAEDVELTDQIAQVVDFMELLDAPVRVDCQEAAIKVDPERFRQVLRNLLVNAHRHGRPTVTVSGRVQHDRYICHVIDHGPGVPGDLEDHLFSRFSYRRDGSVSGHVGLGLSIVQQLCALMGMEVSYRRIRGETHFVVSIPLADSDEGTSETTGRPRMIHHPKRLVRVDDRLVQLPA